ncbi:MAG TPA: penicillin-insensitive murein endopeptidase [Kofleriaceae bacterium]|nr:penicillin-insensitive murein endopeptidase [Kofleriaceae bacterium]
MRALVGLAVALGLLLVSPLADAKSQHRPEPQAVKHSRDRSRRAVRGKATKAKPTKARAARTSAVRGHDHLEIRERAAGQSIGAPWDGRLADASQLPPGDGYHIRRPERSFGTETTIELVERAIGETLDAFPDEHVLAIGDISAEAGGLITQHRSHQSGRDVDVGLFYKQQPDGYPASFVHADEDNLDCAATFKLLESFLATANDDGGVLMVFLDFEVQGILYRWALDHGVSERRLERIFQYPHGRGSSEGLVRHEPNHDNHMHVRFRCQASDTACE